MRTPTTTLFKVKKLKKLNGKRAWMIHRRSQGKRERIYFVTEREARQEAFRRNQKHRGAWYQGQSDPGRADLRSGLHGGAGQDRQNPA